MYDLTAEICRFLEIEDIAKELNVLLLVSFNDGLKWLKTQNYDTISIRPQNEETDVSCQGDSRSEAEKEYSQIIGETTERFVFQELIKLFKDRYSGETDEFQNASIFKTKSVEVIWHRMSGDTYAHKDITIIEDGIEKYIEVKATSKPEDIDATLFLSPKEWGFMKENKGCYFLARVFNGHSPTEIIFVKMDNISISEL